MLNPDQLKQITPQEFLALDELRRYNRASEREEPDLQRYLDWYVGQYLMPSKVQVPEGHVDQAGAEQMFLRTIEILQEENGPVFFHKLVGDTITRLSAFLMNPIDSNQHLLLYAMNLLKEENYDSDSLSTAWLYWRFIAAQTMLNRHIHSY